MPQQPLPWYKREVFHYLRERTFAESEERRRVKGSLLLLCSLSLCSLSLYLLFSTALTTDWSKGSGEDNGGGYYCYLLPSCVPATIIFVIANWFSLKFFRHNN